MNQAQKGFLQLELLLILLFLGVSTEILMHNQRCWINSYYRFQLRAASQLVAADLRQLQAQVMFKHQTHQCTLMATVDKNGYMIFYGAPEIVLRKRSFPLEFCSDVYFKSSTSLSFGTSGSPSSSGTLVLSHRKLPQKTISVELQPVTGRVLIHED